MVSGLFVGNYHVDRFSDGVSTDLLAVFRGDMYQTRNVPASVYWVGDFEDDEMTTCRQLVCPGSVLVDRLDLIGCTLSQAKHRLQDAIDESRQRFGQWKQSVSNDSDIMEHYDAELAKYENLDAETWIEELARLGLPEGRAPKDFRSKSRTNVWLLDQLLSWDHRYALRLILEIFPQYCVRLDLTTMVEEEQIGSDLAAECADAVRLLRAFGSLYSPVVVLTEGRSDALILGRALKVLYPHLVDLIRFMDYSRKPEGGAGALVTTVRTFARGRPAHYDYPRTLVPGRAAECVVGVAGGPWQVWPTGQICESVGWANRGPCPLFRD